VGYKIISVNINDENRSDALGISYSSNNGIFTSIYTTDQQAFEQLKTLLLTRVGERYGYPQYGTHLLNIIFQPITEEMKSDIQDLIVEPVSRFLPYINIDNIKITTRNDDPNMLENTATVSISYSINLLEDRTLLLAATEQGTITVSQV
jgi:phage baseplate assembly protein W